MNGIRQAARGSRPGWGYRLAGLSVWVLLAAGCESTGSSSAPPGATAAPLVAEVQGESNPVAQGEIGPVWNGRGAKKVEFGRVVQSRPVVIDGRTTLVGRLGGGVVGAAATVPKRVTAGSLAVSAAGAVGGAIVGGKVEEIMTRQNGQEILVRLEEGKVVTITQSAEDGYFQEGDFVKVVHGERGAFVSLSNADERDVIKREESRVRREGAWYEHRADGT